MTMHPREAELNDYADEALPPAATAAVAAHLAACGDCRHRVERLLALTAGLSALPRLGEPARDLWPALAARIAAGESGDELEAAETGRADPVRAPARVTPLRPRRGLPPAALQRAAAAVLLFVGGVGVGRVTLPQEPQPVAATPLEAAKRVQQAGSEYVAAVAAFTRLSGQANESELEQGRAAAFAAMYGASKELTTVPSRDSSAREIYRTVSSTRSHLASHETDPAVPF